MTLEETIINIGVKNKIQIAKLYIPSAKAIEKPDSGMTIQNKSAYYVIKDCAKLANEFLPIKVYQSIKDADLKGKISIDIIKEFVTRVHQKNNAGTVLLSLIIDIINATKNITNKENIVIEPNLVNNVDDIYGDYGVEVDMPSQPSTDTLINSNDAKIIIQELINYFEAKK